MGGYNGANGKFPSFSSPVWRSTFSEVFRNFIRHVKKSPYARRVVGFHPSMGISWEWFHWGSQSGEFCDYSECGQQDFRRWLKAKYGNDQALRTSWRNDTVTLASAQVPSTSRRSRPATGFYFDVNSQMDVIDYNDYQHDIVVDNILNFARIVKEETDNRSMVGVYYGYTFYLFEHEFFGQGSGHFHTRRLLDAKEIDFLMSPTGYSWRHVGGATCTMVPPWTCNANGKLYWTQSDLRSHWSTQNGFGNIKTIQESISCMNRELARVLAEGNAIQWLDFSDGWTAGDKRLMNVVAGHVRIFDQYRGRVRDFAPGNYLLVVLDEDLMGRFDVNKPPYAGELVEIQRKYLTEAGIPWKGVLFSDLMRHPELLECGAVLFLNQFRLDKARADFIRNKVLGKVRLTCFMGPVGILSPSGLTSETASSLIGQSFALERRQLALRGKATGLFKGLEGLEWGASASMKYPLTLFPETPAESTVAATLEEDGRPAALYLENEGGSVFWSAIPGLRAPMLRALARKAGIPVVLDTDDVVYAGCGYIGVHASKDGMKEISLIGNGTPREIISGRSWPAGTTKISIPMVTGENRIFIME